MTTSRDLIASARASLTEPELPRNPRRHLAVVSCMDARVDPLRILGARLGDLHIIRNAGAVVTDDVLRSLIISQHFLATRRIHLIMHTDCGMLGFDDAGFRRRLRDETGVPPPTDFGGFEDLEAELRRGVAAITEAPWLPHRDAVSGSIYDVASGSLRRVV